MDPDLKIHRRRLPHWELKGSTYFITFRVHPGKLSMRERLMVLDHIRAGGGRFYTLIAVVVLPDHAHLLITPLQGYELSRIMKGMKGVTARLVNESRGRRGTLWQDESFDRIMRDQPELDEKLNYIYTNAVKARLVEEPDEYKAMFISPES